MTSALQALNAIVTGTVRRAAKEGAREAVEEAQTQTETSSSEASGGSSRGRRGLPILLLLVGAVAGYLLVRRRRSSSVDDIVDSIDTPADETSGGSTFDGTEEESTEVGAEADD